jgi:hypothetical protein
MNAEHRDGGTSTLRKPSTVGGAGGFACQRIEDHAPAGETACPTNIGANQL